MFLINPYILQASGNPLWDGLLAYYTADNTPNDALGNYNGTLVNGATYGTGIINNGFSFDGVNDKVDISNFTNLQGGDPFSISLWYYDTKGSGNRTFIAQQESGTNKGMHFYIRSTDQYRFQILGDTGGIILESNNLSTLTPPSTTNTWYNLVVTYDGGFSASGVTFYINGSSLTLNTSQDNLSVYASTGTVISIGNREDNATPFGGIIDEVGVWDRELTASEVTELYNSGAGLQY